MFSISRLREIGEMLSKLPVLSENEAIGMRKSLLQGGRQTMIPGSLKNAKSFVPMMVELTEQTLSQIPGMVRVDVNIRILEGRLVIDYIQNWDNGLKNAYGEDVIRTGEDVFEVFASAKSAERMAQAWNK